MTAFEEMPMGVGSTFGFDVAVFQEAVDLYDQNDFIENVSELITNLNESNPYIGRRVIMDFSEAITLVSLADGSERSLEPTGDPIICQITGFSPKIIDVDGALGADLCVEMYFGENSYLEGFAAMIDAQAIYNMELEQKSHPFIDEARNFYQAMEGFPDVIRQYPNADLEDYMDEFVGALEARSRVLHAEVELLVAESAEIDLRRKEYPPYWVDHDEDEDEESDDLPDEEFRATHAFRGTIRGNVVGFQTCEGFGEAFDLEVILAIPPDNDISDDPTYRYALISTKDISWGRVLSGPSCN
jgi:hypothetical protein